MPSLSCCICTRTPAICCFESRPRGQCRGLGLVDVGDEADQEAGTVKAAGGEGGEIVTGDRGDALLGAVDAAAIGMLFEGVVHPETPGQRARVLRLAREAGEDLGA